MVLGTKCFGATAPSANKSGLSRKHIVEAVDDSLRRLQTDYIDLYQAHQFDNNVPLDETLRAMTWYPQVKYVISEYPIGGLGRC